MKITVVGLGYVGSVAAAVLSAQGHDVLGVDVDRRKVDSFASGSIPIYEPGLGELIYTGTGTGKLSFVHVDDVAEFLGEVVLIATGTPTADSGAADLSQVRSALEWVRVKQPSGGVVAMKSTVPPGSGLRLMETVLKGTAWEYISNPEFLREGQAIYDWYHPDRLVIGGESESAVQIIKEMYVDIETPCVLTDITSAEMIKYAANAFLATKVSFINEIAAICDQLGTSIDDVVSGISYDPRIGAGFLRPGVGYGGSCFPKDVRALDYLALANGHNFELLRSVITVNNRQRMLPYHALTQLFGTVRDIKVAVLGLAFKPNTDDIREAPSLDLIRTLTEEGAQVKGYDPQAVPAAAKVLPLSVSLTENLMECVQDAQAVVIMTEWPEIVTADWRSIHAATCYPRLLFDGRNALDPANMQALGFQYQGVGRGKRVSQVSESEVGAQPVDV